MKKSRWIVWLIILITLLSLWIDLPIIPATHKFPIIGNSFGQIFSRFPLKLGLDLQGGTELVLLTDTSKIDSSQRDQAVESARQVIERRVNLFGVSESVVQSSKLGDQRRILVELPGVKDSSAAADLVGKTAELDFRELPATMSAEASRSGLPAIFFAKPTGLTGADLKGASVTFTNGNTRTARSGPSVSLQFTDQGAQKFADITKRNVGKPLPIFLDGQPLEAPVVQQEIIGGNAVITASFTVDQAKQLATQLSAGALPVPIHIINQQTIGPQLGGESIQKSIVAGVIGLSLVMLYMLAYYGFYGLVADIALIIYTLLNLAVYKTGLFILPPVTLSLAGIAGFVLSIGMAVDANILIFERTREERRSGNSLKASLDLGFKRAWSSIRDSNISSLITASILYFMGTGLIKGFALTLAIGVLISMFTAVTVTRNLLSLFVKSKS